MRRVIQPCRMCKKDILLKIDDECPELWEKMLLPAATCNRCHDMHCARRDSLESIEATCTVLDRARTYWPSKLPKVIEDSRPILEAATRKYAKAYASLCKADEYIWDIDFVDQLIEKPKQWIKIITAYKNGARQIFKERKA